MNWNSFKKNLQWLDPFFYSELLLKKMRASEISWIRFAVEAFTAFVSAWVLYAVIGFILQTSMPLVIVVSGSMEPLMHRGDVVLLQGVSENSLSAPVVPVPFPVSNSSFEQLGSVRQVLDERGRLVVYGVEVNNEEFSFDHSGDVVVYFSSFLREPVIHRAVLKITAPDGVFVLTKGDANPTFDQDCGRVVMGVPQRPCITAYPIPLQEVRGKMLYRVPLLGYVKLLLFDDILELVTGCPPSPVRGEYCAYLKGVQR